MRATLPPLYLQLLLTLLVFVALARPGNAQELEKISSGRPDRSQGTSTVPKHTLQLETGLNYQKDDLNGTDVRTHAYPSLTLRLGLLDRLELRIDGSLQDSVIATTDRRRVKGIGPLGIGARVRLWEQAGVLPEAALTAMVTLPVGSSGLNPDHPEGSLNLGLSNSLSDRLSLTYSFRYGRMDNGTELLYASNLRADLNDKISMYAEFFRMDEERNQAENNADIGILWFPMHNLQLDVAAGIGLNEAAPDYFVTMGVSIRLPR